MQLLTRSLSRGIRRAASAAATLKRGFRCSLHRHFDLLARDEVILIPHLPSGGAIVFIRLYVGGGKGEYPAVLTGNSALPTLTVRLRVAVIKAEMRRHDLARTKNAQAVRTCGVVGRR